MDSAHGPQLGHLNLRVSDLDRAVAFYSRIGYHVVRHAPGAPIAFLGLDQPGAFQLGLSVDERPGFDHFALAYESPGELARACKQLLAEGVELAAAHDFGVSTSLYFKDPDGNEFELYWEKPRDEWPPEDERFRLRQLDAAAFIARFSD